MDNGVKRAITNSGEKYAKNIVKCHGRGAETDFFKNRFCNVMWNWSQIPFKTFLGNSNYNPKYSHAHF